MNNKVSALSANWFLFLVVVFLIPFIVSVGRAQSSAVNLAGTEWSTGAEIIPTGHLDGSITTVTRYLVFYKQGIAEAAIVTNKSAGSKSELVLELVPESVYNAGTGRHETQMVQRQVQKLVMTPPVLDAKAWKGTYEIKGKSIYLNFPGVVIDAQISGSLIKGVVTYKTSKAKEAWILSPLTSIPKGTVSGKISSDLIGNWAGTYSCAQGLTNLNLWITQTGSSEISAVFKFSAHPSNPSVPSGSYKMIGAYDSATSKITLRATDWIYQPPGYVTVDLVGNVSQRNTRISGEVVNSSCTTFTLEKK